jgi:hypothetical protein
MELHYYISNDTCHDMLLVKHCFMLHWKFLKDQRCPPTKQLFGMMVALDNSKAIELGTLSHVIQA